jgi:hypothetical protein
MGLGFETGIFIGVPLVLYLNSKNIDLVEELEKYLNKIKKG